MPAQEPSISDPEPVVHTARQHFTGGVRIDDPNTGQAVLQIDQAGVLLTVLDGGVP